MFCFAASKISKPASSLRLDYLQQVPHEKRPLSTCYSTDRRPYGNYNIVLLHSAPWQDVDGRGHMGVAQKQVPYNKRPFGKRNNYTNLRSPRLYILSQSNMMAKIIPSAQVFRETFYLSFHAEGCLVLQTNPVNCIFFGGTEVLFPKKEQ